MGAPSGAHGSRRLSGLARVPAVGSTLQVTQCVKRRVLKSWVGGGGDRAHPQNIRALPVLGQRRTGTLAEDSGLSARRSFPGASGGSQSLWGPQLAPPRRATTSAPSRHGRVLGGYREAGEEEGGWGSNGYTRVGQQWPAGRQPPPATCA